MAQLVSPESVHHPAKVYPLRVGTPLMVAPTPYLYVVGTLLVAWVPLFKV
jgi:hypothetical protein